MATKAKAQVRHARQRFAERHQLDVSARELGLMVKMIQSGQGTFVRRTSLRASVWDIEFEGRTRRVVYDKHRKTIVTVLPVEVA